MEDNAVMLHEQTSATALILHGDSFQRIERMAEVMASGKSTIPDHLRSKGDCMAIIMQSMQWGMNPYAVAQKTHLVSGKLGYEAQLVAAVLNNSGLLKTRFDFDFFGPWEKVIGKFDIKRGDKGEYRTPGWKLADEEGIGVRVSATLRGETSPRTLELLLAQARTRNSTMWADDPKQQLCYLAEKKWARLYAPDAILGVYTTDELQEIDMGSAVRVDDHKPTSSYGRQEPKPYPDERLEKMLPKWKAGASGGDPAGTVIATLSSKYTLTDEQIKRIRTEVRAPIDAAVAEEVPAEGTDAWMDDYNAEPEKEQAK